MSSGIMLRENIVQTDNLDTEKIKLELIFKKLYYAMTLMQEIVRAAWRRWESD